MLTTTPSAKSRRRLRGGRCGSVSSGSARPSSVLIPITIRYSAPSTLTTVNAVADETRIADSPTTANVRCTSVPTWIPSTEASPAARPWWMLRVTM